MKKSLIVIILAVAMLAVLTGCQGVANAQSNGAATDISRQINVSGVGKVYLAPDIAYIYVGVHTQNSEVAAALSENNQQAQQISSTLTGLGIAAEDIQTSAFNVYPQQNYNPDGSQGDITYAVDNTVNVKVRDLQKLGDILNAVVANGANSINGISFDVENRTDAEAQARKLAVQDAQAKAKELADLSGVELGELVSVSASAPSAPSPVYSVKGGAAAMDASVPVAAGQLVIEIDANMTYAIH